MTAYAPSLQLSTMAAPAEAEAKACSAGFTALPLLKRSTASTTSKNAQILALPLGIYDVAAIVTYETALFTPLLRKACRSVKREFYTNKEQSAKFSGIRGYFSDNLGEIGLRKCSRREKQANVEATLSVRRDICAAYYWPSEDRKNQFWKREVSLLIS